MVKHAKRTIEDKIDFLMGLNKGVTLDCINPFLTQECIKVLNYLKNIGIVVCQTESKTYETIFQTQLELVPSKAGHAGYDTKGYRELSPAKIPEPVEGKVVSAHLNYVRRPIN